MILIFIPNLHFLLLIFYFKLKNLIQLLNLDFITYLCIYFENLIHF